ncbi:MAG: phenylalanine--tRNA ligase subunit beta [Bacteroidales bacterium]|nr:phenylalanine--tRNA ligase subunit beta [Bacteroidales bacterium]
MLLSYNWLKEFLPDLKKTPEEMVIFLSKHVAQVEGSQKLSLGLNNKIVVGEILEINDHPHADKLHLVLIDIGKEKLKIVCGASNIEKGQKVPLALSGATLSGNITIKPSVIRGIESNGMLCSARELGIGADDKGIYILAVDSVVGQTLIDSLGLNDVLLEIENKSITHRPDLFNHWGIAREIKAGLSLKNKVKEPKMSLLKKEKEKLKINIKIQESDICPRYMAVAMDNIKIEPSSLEIQNRLRNLGIQPINNVVDIMNYVMLEVGQPLHSFDFDQISVNKNQAQITIRSAQNKEKILALDGEEYELQKKDIIITNHQGPIALAGLMGGQDSGINKNTQRIIVESANFNSAGVRRTAWRLGLRTEAVLRFEKGLPLILTDFGIHRAIYLLQKLTGAKVASKIYDVKFSSLKPKSSSIIFNFNWAEKFIGSRIPDQKIIKILQDLNCQIGEKSKEDILVTPPDYRPDLNIPEDLIEELIRIHGLDKIEPKPIKALLEPISFSPEFILERKIRQILTACSFDEVYNYAFTSEKGSVRIVNPLNSEQGYLIESLQPGLIKNALKNKANFPEFRIFEIARIFDPEEKRKIAGLLYGDDKQIFSYAKGVLELIWKELGIDLKQLIYKNSDIYIGKKKLGELKKIQDKSIIFEMDISLLLDYQRSIKKYSKISSYPSIKRDLAFLLDKKYSWIEVSESISNVSSLIKEIDLFDVFDCSDHRKDIDLDRKRSLAFHIIYQSMERTLRTEEIDKIQEEIIKVLQKKFNAQLRNF